MLGSAHLRRDIRLGLRRAMSFHQFAPGARHQTDVVFPPKRDIRGLRTTAEGMSVARMVVTLFRRFGVSFFLRGEIVRIKFR
jgi:hypothetical protein